MNQEPKPKESNNMKTKIEVKSIWGSILFEYEKENNSVKETLIEAVKRGANLCEADLRKVYATQEGRVREIPLPVSLYGVCSEV